MRLHWSLGAVVSARGGPESRSSAAGLLLSYNSPRYRGLPAFIALAVVVVVVVAVHSTTTTQCCCSSSTSSSPLTIPPEARYLASCVVAAPPHLCSALPLPPLLLLLCPARPIGHTPNPHPAPVAPKQQQQQQLSAPDLPPAPPRTLLCVRACVLLSPTRPAASTSLTSPDRPTKLPPSSHHSSPASSSQLSPLALLHAYCCARVLACVSVCGSTVRFTSATACLLAACCLLCWSPPHRAAHHSSTSSPLSLRNAAPRAPPDLLLRHRRQQRGRLPSA